MSSGERGTRLEIQVLRALAVVLVVVFHVAPPFLPGGYVGVDAFFVVSGYLITLHLKRELERTGTIALGEFWARRARRLLPASLLVLSASLVGVVLLVPLSLWRQFAREVLASTLYVQNWRLAFDSVAYSAAENDASPVQHFWSLSVEEQFYLVWPLLLLGVAWGSRRRGRALVPVTQALLVLIVVASMAWSTWVTDYDRKAAYFSTFVRAWEFGVGALLAFVRVPKLAGWSASVLSYAGLATLIASAVLFDSETSFPGWLAVFPVIGTLAVLSFGAEGGRASVENALGIRPVVWLGDHSYGIYLWHWPLLVLGRLAAGRELATSESLVAVGVTLALAFVSKRYVEDPVRYARPLVARRAVFTFAYVAAGMGVVAAATEAVDRHRSVVTRVVSPIAERAKREVVPCFGAGATQPGGEPCDSPVPPGEVVPAPMSAYLDKVNACMTDNESASLRVCEFGDRESDLVVGLVGDSHAAHWLPALQLLARERELRVLTFLKGSCPYTEAERSSSRAVSETCERWKDDVEEELEKREDVDALFVSASALNGFVTAPGEDPGQVAARGFSEAWNDLPDHIERVVVLRDIPRPREDVILCLERAARDGELEDEDECARARAESLLDDPLVEAAQQSDRALLLDFSPVFCDAEFCHPVVGGALVYRDGHHMTATFARTLAPLLEAELDRRLPSLQSL